MTPELEKKPLPPKKENTFKTLAAGLLRSVRHNLHWKLLALVLAVLMWAGLISQDPTLIREKVFTDVPVTISGSESLKNNRLIVTTDLLSEPPTVRMKADVPQMEYNNVTALTYNPRIDLSRIRETGTQTVRIMTSSTSAYGSVVELTPDTIEVEVDEYVTRYRIPVALSLTGEYPNGYYSDTVNGNPSLITVSGPKSLVEKVRRAVAVFDKASVNTAQRKFSTSVPFELLDENDNVIESKLITVTSDSISIDSIVADFELYPTKIISLSGMALTKNAPERGYEVKSVSVTPADIRAAATSENLEQYAIDSLFLDQAVDLSGRTESFNEVIRVRRPTEIRNLNPDSVTVSVEIGPVIVEKTFSEVNLEAQDTPQGLSAQAGVRRAAVKITAPELILEKLKATDIHLVYSLKDLAEGVSEVAVECSVPALEGIGYTYTIDPQTIEVTLKQK